MKQGRSLKQAKAEQAAKKRRAKKIKRILVLLAEIVVLISLLGIGYIITKKEKLSQQQPSGENIQTNEENNDERYTTLALFRGDSTEGNLKAGTHADTIMVVSIDKESKEIRLVSIYRDLLTMQSDGEIKKANNSYFSGGPMAAINMLNQNFDLNIQDYISIDYKVIADVVDFFGGIEINVTNNEAEEMNRQLADIAEKTDKDAVSVTGGLQTLDGTQIVAYTRISKTNLGGDYARTEREIQVMKKLDEKVKQSDSMMTEEILNQVLSQVYTSIESEELSMLVTETVQYALQEPKGFAFNYIDGTIEGIGSVVIPIEYEENVQELHSFLYPSKDYVVSGIVREIASKMEQLQGTVQEEEQQDDSSNDTEE